MFTPKTVFVVGAGASCEIGLPAGDALRDRIVDMTYFEDRRGFSGREFNSAIRKLCDRNPELRQHLYPAMKQLRQGLPNVASIDTYLDIHRGNKVMIDAGKMAIVIAILEAERNSALIGKFNLRMHDPEDLVFHIATNEQYDASWYVHFGRLLTQNIALENVDLIFDNVSFITFNYDRCIETFAFEWLKQTFGIDEQHAANIASKLEVLHVYGSIGTLPWKGGDAPFGISDNMDFSHLAQGIKTFTESVDSEMASLIKSRIVAAETLVFLGFGWLPQNLDILDAQRQANAKRIFFSTFGVSETDRETVRTDLTHLLEKQVADSRDASCRAFEERKTCADLFRNNWRQLTRA